MSREERSHVGNNGKIALTALLAALIALCVYIQTLLPGAGGYGDTAKFHFVGRVGGIPHPTGFPTYLMLNRLVAQLPWGRLAWRINLLSAVLGALTIFVTCATLCRLTKNRPASFLASLLLAFSFTFWSVCVIAEVYTLWTLLISIVIFLLLRWRETGRRSWLYGAVAVYMLSLGNHPTVLLMLPALLFIVLATERGILCERRVIAAVAALALLGAAQYLYLLLLSRANPPYQEALANSMGGLLSFITGGAYKRRYFAPTITQLLRASAPMYARLLADQITLPGVALAAAGFVVLLRRQRVWGVFFLIYYLVTVLLTINGPHVEQPVYFIPATMALTVPIAFMTAGAWEAGLVRRLILGAVMAGIVLTLFVRNHPVIDLSRKQGYDGIAERVLAAVKPDSIIMSEGYQWTELLLYKILGEEMRAGDDVYVLHHWRPEALARYAAGDFDIWAPYVPRFSGPQRFNLYLFTTDKEPRSLRAIRHAGWRTVPVLAIEPPLTAELRSPGEDAMLLAAARDEGMTILSDEAYDLLHALGLRRGTVSGDSFGWAAAAAVVREKGRWRGPQPFRYAPVEIRGAKGERVPGTPFLYPADIDIRSAGYGKGNRSEIHVNGVRISPSNNGVNLAVIDRATGAVRRSVNIPPAELQQFRTLYLYELIKENP